MILIGVGVCVCVWCVCMCVREREREREREGQDFAAWLNVSVAHVYFVTVISVNVVNNCKVLWELLSERVLYKCVIIIYVSHTSHRQPNTQFTSHTDWDKHQRQHVVTTVWVTIQFNLLLNNQTQDTLILIWFWSFSCAVELTVLFVGKPS